MTPNRATPWIALMALSWLPTSAWAQPFHLEDSLRSGTSAGSAIGGAFGPEGWTVTAVDDRIWYALPRLASGYVELTVANISAANLPLADHEIFAMYEAGHGIEEPIEYAPAFRVNHYKALVRIYGNAEPERFGFMKLMWGMCPSGAPGYDACGCSSFFEEPFDTPGEWTGAAVRMRVEWGEGHTRLLRDGVEVVGIDWSESGLSFGPAELHMMIGSPRNDGGLSAMPIGAVFSDLVVDGTMGPLATCPGTELDAGAPDVGGVDGGALDGGTLDGSTGDAAKDLDAARLDVGPPLDAGERRRGVDAGCGCAVEARRPGLSMAGLALLALALATRSSRDRRRAGSRA